MEYSENPALRGGRTERGTDMRLLIADDHDLVREALKLVLGKLDPNAIVMECGDYQEALALAEQHEDLDLAILDLNMPGMAGLAGIEAFRTRFPSTPTLVLSGYYRRQDVVEVLKNGAMGFVPKTLGSEAMLNAFRLVLSGEKFIPSELLADDGADPNELVGLTGREKREDPLEVLTAREREVLEKLLEGLTNKEIGRDLGIEEVTVKLHLRSVYRKIGAKNRAQAVKIALSYKWRR